MLRSVLASLGDLFKNKLVDFGMGLFAVVFLLPEIRSINDLSLLNMRQIGIYTLIVVGVAAVFQIIGALCTWLSETMPVSVSFSIQQWDPTAKFNWEKRSKFPKPAFGVSSHIITVRIVNNEPIELTDCYVVLKEIREHRKREKRESSYLRNYLMWKKTESCKTTIGAYGGEEIFLVTELLQYPFSREKEQPQFGVWRAPHEFRLCICDNATSRYYVGETGNIEFVTEVHGRLSGRDVRSPRFTVYVHVVTKDGVAAGFRLKTSTTLF